jgi:hypothetical protein
MELLIVSVTAAACAGANEINCSSCRTESVRILTDTNDNAAACFDLKNRRIRTLYHLYDYDDYLATTP